MSLVTETVQSGWRRRPAFTLPELLVVTAIIILLTSLLMTGLRRVKRQADSLVCMSNLRQIAIDFQIISQSPDDLKRWSPELAARGGFGLTSFIDKIYEAGKYFPDRDPDNDFEIREYVRGEKVCLCPSGPAKLRVRENRMVLGSVQRAIVDPRDVSYGFNARLYKVFRLIPDTENWQHRFVTLTPNIFNRPRAPKTALVFDVDARSARKAGVSPHLVAPPIEPGGGYRAQPMLDLVDGMQWFPSQRHQGKTNIALLDGSVLSEPDLLAKQNRINWADSTYAGEWVNGVYVSSSGGRSPKQRRSLWSEDAFSDDMVH